MYGRRAGRYREASGLPFFVGFFWKQPHVAPMIQRFFQQKRGFVLAMIGASLFPLIAGFGLVVDLGSLWRGSQVMATVARSAALSSAHVMDNEQQARAFGESIFVQGLKGYDLSAPVVRIQTNMMTPSCQDASIRANFNERPYMVCLEAQAEVKSIMMRLFGASNTQVSVQYRVVREIGVNNQWAYRVLP